MVGISVFAIDSANCIGHNCRVPVAIVQRSPTFFERGFFRIALNLPRVTVSDFNRRLALVCSTRRIKGKRMINAKTFLRTLAPGLAMAAFSLGMSQAQTTLDPAWRVPPDTSKPGFQWNYFQHPPNRGNSTARTESDLAGLSTDATGAPLENQGDPTVVGAAIGPAAPANPTNALLYFEITNVINLSKVDGDTRGHFTPDVLEPGLSGSVSSDGQAAEILTYITLPAGTIVMGVNSDDGFQTSSGSNPTDAFGRVVLGEYNGGRGAGDTLFTNIVTQAGTYPFRTIWENGGGNSNIEWFSVDYSGGATNYHLINDVANGGFPAYRAATGAVKPYVRSVSPQPVPRQLETTSRSVAVVLADGTTQVDANSISLKIDGNAATITKQRVGNMVTVDTGPLPGMRLAGEDHTAVLTFQDTGTYSRTQQWAFKNIENLILPASPVTGENFDSYPEATDPTNAAPAGWVLTNYSWLEIGASGFGANGGAVWDLTAQANDPYLNWCMVNTNTAATLESEILDNYQAQTINGIPVTDRWMSGNCLFAASDSRARRVSIGGVNQPNDYAPQIQIAVSAPFNLSTVTNPVLTFSSGVRISGNGEEDGLEYSVDNGTNWLPAIFMFNANRLFYQSDGSYDAVKILTNVWTDVAKFPVVQDPTTRDFISAGPLGQKFGDVLKTPISAALAPYIANRNDTALSRKVEAIRLPAASNKSQVRLRFNHYGSCGWEWAVDNIAFYDIAPTVAAQPRISSIAISNGQVTVQWINGGTLESTPGLTAPVWTPTGNSSGSFTESLPATGNKFYRVKQ
jgi:hypothetical protein